MIGHQNSLWHSNNSASFVFSACFFDVGSVWRWKNIQSLNVSLILCISVNNVRDCEDNS